ncbi:hypothetical protein CW304_32790 [Bacillus sp. UFRGS-B20]|nr:hypothetical protein CW304_32790 [Bacillus sp. UFRGS-B20]
MFAISLCRFSFWLLILVELSSCSFDILLSITIFYFIPLFLFGNGLVSLLIALYSSFIFISIFLN